MDLHQLLKLPDLENCKNLLAVGPHPDDNEVGAGATIAKLAEKGCKITYLVVTDGRMGTVDANADLDQLVEKRKTETEKAASFLGVSKVIYLGFPDGGYHDEQALAKGIVKVIREERPEFVMTVDPFLPYEVHPDHISVGKACAQACLFSVFPHFYSAGENKPAQNIWNVTGIAFYNTAYPNTLIDVESTWPMKIQALAMHESQFNGESFEMLKFYFDLKAKSLGEAKGYGHAEAFKILTPTLLHGNVDALYW